MDALMDDSYEIYRILDREVRNDVVYYKIQWKHYLPKYNSWEPESNLNSCAEMVGKFENKRVDKIIGAKRFGHDSFYILKLLGSSHTDEMPFAHARKYLLYKLIHYLESRISFQAAQGVGSINEPLRETPNPIGQPLKIIYVTNIQHGLQYLVEYENNQFSFESAKYAHRNFPILVVDFLQENSVY